MISETILRQYIRELFLEAVGLPGGELSKIAVSRRPERFGIFKMKMDEGDYFDVITQRANKKKNIPEKIEPIRIPPDENRELYELMVAAASVGSGSPEAQEKREEYGREYTALIRRVPITGYRFDGTKYVITSGGQIVKTGPSDIRVGDPAAGIAPQQHGFKLQKGDGPPLGVINELRLTEDINKAVAGEGKYISTSQIPRALTVVLQDPENPERSIVLKNVTGASAAGTDKIDGITSKSDVNIAHSGGVLKVSMKMINAGHWMSGDRFFRRLSPFINLLQGGGIKVGTNLVAQLDPIHSLVLKDGTTGEIVSDSPNFTIEPGFFDENFYRGAVFGWGQNSADVILKGNYYFNDPNGEWNSGTRTLIINGHLWKTLDDIPYRYKPEPIITGSAGRKKTIITPRAAGDVTSPQVDEVTGMRFQFVIRDRVAKQLEGGGIDTKAHVLSLSNAVDPSQRRVGMAADIPHTGKKVKRKGTGGVMFTHRGQDQIQYPETIDPRTGEPYVHIPKKKMDLIREFVRELLLTGLIR